MIKKTIEYIKIPKKLFFGVLIFLALAISFWAVKPQKILVDISTISEGPFEKVIVDEGITQFVEKHIVTAPADGIIPEHTRKTGDLVKKGEVLVNFEWDRDFKIRTPTDGYILNVFEKDRRHVPRGTPLFEIGNPEKIEVVAKILSEEVVEIKVGQNAYITKWGGKKELKARVHKIEPLAQEEISALGVKEQRVKVYLTITEDKEKIKKLGDGYRIEANIVVENIENTLRVPTGALFSTDGKTAVFVVEKKRIKMTPVEIGSRNQYFADLKTKLAPGTKVVLYPGSQLKSGDKVKIRLKK